MSTLKPEEMVQSGAREVRATFGLREARIDPTWEVEFASSLKLSHSVSGLLELFGRFRSCDSAFDATMRRVLMRAMCKSVGNDLQVGLNVVLIHPETFEIGDCVFIGAQTMIQGRFDGTCRIGNHVWIGPQAYFDARNLVIEDYVGWGPGAKVLGSSHTGEPVEQPIIATALIVKPVTVRYGADVGMNASILPGVSIGTQSIVGAGAVVSHDVPDFAIVAGVPAKVLRDRREG